MKYTPPVGRLLGHRDQSPAGAKHGAGATQPLAADGVEDDVDGFDGVFEDICRVYCLVCAEFEDEIQVRRRCGPDDVGAGRAGELDGEAADGASRTVDEDAPVRAEPAVVEQPLQGGERGQRDRGALGMTERPRLRHEQFGGQRGVVGRDAIAVERGEREHLVAGRDHGDVAADFLDHSAEFVGRDRRQTVDRPLQLAAGDRRRVHADERLRQTGSWPVGVLDRELFGTACRAQPDDPHHATFQSGRRCRREHAPVPVRHRRKHDRFVIIDPEDYAGRRSRHAWTSRPATAALRATRSGAAGCSVG